MTLNNDEIKKTFNQVWGWRYNKKTQEIEPPCVNYPLPEFVNKRLHWVQKAIKMGGSPTFNGAVHFMLDTDREKDLRKEWEELAGSDYLPFSKEYIDWLDGSYFSDVRQMAIVSALIYGAPKEPKPKKTIKRKA